MKIWETIGLLAVIGSQIANAGPHPAFTAETVTGIVEYAVWRSGFEINRVYATPKGEPQDESVDLVPEHWIIVLRDPKGLTDNQRIYVSWAYQRLPIDWAWRRFTRDLQETHLYLRLSGPKDWPVKVGSKVKVQKLRYTGGDFDGSYSVGSVEFDGIAAKLPKNQMDPSWRNVEQPGPAQPATQPADKQPPKDQPSTPTSKDAPR